jgi:hypothetical protein
MLKNVQNSTKTRKNQLFQEKFSIFSMYQCSPFGLLIHFFSCLTLSDRLKLVFRTKKNSKKLLCQVAYYYSYHCGRVISDSTPRICHNDNLQKKIKKKYRKNFRKNFKKNFKKNFWPQRSLEDIPYHFKIGRPWPWMLGLCTPTPQK